MSLNLHQFVVYKDAAISIGVVVVVDQVPREGVVLIRWGNPDVPASLEEQWCDISKLRVATLADHLPYEFSASEYDTTRAYRFRNDEVIEVHKSSKLRWPGKSKNVLNWYVIDGHAIGWNEGVRGWSFEVIKYPKGN